MSSVGSTNKRRFSGIRFESLNAEYKIRTRKTEDEHYQKKILLILPAKIGHPCPLIIKTFATKTVKQRR